MNSLSNILQKGYERYKTECLYAHSLSDDKFHEFEGNYYSSFKDFLKKDCYCPAIIGRYFTEGEIEEAKIRFHFLKLKVWECILIYKYTNTYEEGEPHHLDDYYEMNMKHLYSGLDKMPMEDSDIIEAIVHYYDNKFQYIVLWREREFVAEGLYQDLLDNGIYTGEIE